MTNSYKLRILLPVCLIVFLLFPLQAAHSYLVPVTALPEQPAQRTAQLATLPSLSDFIQTVKNGNAGQIVGVYVLGVMAYPIVQQVGADPGYVSTKPETITQFRLAKQFNSIGLLAHDYLAGASFNNMRQKDEVVLVHGDGNLEYYLVTDIQRFQALDPTNPYSNFVDLRHQTTLSAEQLFLRTYGLGNSTLVFQTCISTSQVASWGRLFVIASPETAAQPGLMQALPVIQKALLGASLTMQPLQTASSR